MKKNDREKLLKFEAEGRECAKILRLVGLTISIPHFKGLGMRNLQYELSMPKKS